MQVGNLTANDPFQNEAYHRSLSIQISNNPNQTERTQKTAFYPFTDEKMQLTRTQIEQSYLFKKFLLAFGLMLDEYEKILNEEERKICLEAFKDTREYRKLTKTHHRQHFKINHQKSFYSFMKYTDDTITRKL